MKLTQDEALILAEALHDAKYRWVGRTDTILEALDGLCKRLETYARNDDVDKAIMRYKPKQYIDTDALQLRELKISHSRLARKFIRATRHSPLYNELFSNIIWAHRSIYEYQYRYTQYMPKPPNRM